MKEIQSEYEPKPRKDLTGLEINERIVLGIDKEKCKELWEKYKQGIISRPQIYWKCQCNICKNIYSHTKDSIEKNYCKCLRGQKISDAIKTFNKYDLTGDYGIGYTSKGEEFYFDLEDYDLIKEYCWHNKKGYMVADIKMKGKQIYLHKLIMNDLDNFNIVDHINRKPNDCRKENLRRVTNQQNSFNTSKRKNNTTGIIGVSYNKKYNKWHSKIEVSGKSMQLLWTSNFEEAIIARLQGELKYFGSEYAPQRDLFEKYNIK